MLCFNSHCEPLTSMCRKNPKEGKTVLCEFVSGAQSLEAICLLHFVNGSACSLLDFLSLSNPGGFCNYRGNLKQDGIAYIVVKFTFKSLYVTS